MGSAGGGGGAETVLELAALVFGPDGWDAFVTGVAAGRFNPLA